MRSEILYLFLAEKLSFVCFAAILSLIFFLQFHKTVVTGGHDRSCYTRDYSSIDCDTVIHDEGGIRYPNVQSPISEYKESGDI